MPSPKPKPTALKVAAGNPGRRALPKNEPKPQGDLDRPPEELTQDEITYWRHAVDSAPATLLKHPDRETLKVWCRAAALHQSARVQVDEEGLTVHGAHGVKAHPLLAVLNQQAQTMLKAGSELGFSPTARTRIQVDAPADDNPYDDIAQRKRA